MSETAIADFWEQAYLQACDRDPRMADDECEEAFWREYAPEYEVRSPLAERATRIIDAVRNEIGMAASVLEIGAGTGAFTRHLFQSAEQLTLVEPSAAMRKGFERLWPSSAVSPRWISEPWEDASPPVSDIVFASNALYRVRRIDTALKKMLRYARRSVYLIQTAGEPYAPPLKVHDGDKLQVLPRWEALHHTLLDLGVTPKVFEIPISPPDGPPYKVVLLSVAVAE